VNLVQLTALHEGSVIADAVRRENVHIRNRSIDRDDEGQATATQSSSRQRRLDQRRDVQGRATFDGADLAQGGDRRGVETNVLHRDITRHATLVGEIDDLIDRAAVWHVGHEDLGAIDCPRTRRGVSRQHRAACGRAVSTRLTRGREVRHRRLNRKGRSGQRSEAGLPRSGDCHRRASTGGARFSHSITSDARPTDRRRRQSDGRRSRAAGAARGEDASLESLSGPTEVAGKCVGYRTDISRLRKRGARSRHRVRILMGLDRENIRGQTALEPSQRRDTGGRIDIDYAIQHPRDCALELIQGADESRGRPVRGVSIGRIERGAG